MEVGSDDKMMVDQVETNAIDSVTKSRREEAKKTLPWIEKYRPSTLQDLISHEEIVKTRTYAINR